MSSLPPVVSTLRFFIMKLSKVRFSCNYGTTVMMMMSMLTAVFLLVGVRIAASFDYSAEALADKVLALPGSEEIADSITFNHFSGYLKIGGTKNMHYWLVESGGNPSEDPIAFWTNGGPGCSGLLGFLTEQGPFRPKKDLSLALNEYSWHQYSSMVFIESPCGVGFSYSDDPAGTGDYHTDDAQTAKDNYELLQAFMNRFPHYRKNDLYITSESYGGHYMPTLAKEIVDRNTAGQDAYLNFKGFAVGNPATTFYSAIPASLDTYWGHQLVSKPLYSKYQTACVDKRIPNVSDCEVLFLAMYKEVGDLNPYALDYPVCTEQSKRLQKSGRSQRTWLMNFLFGGFNSDEFPLSQEGQKQLRDTLGLQPVDGYEPCEEDYMTSYLNQESVKAALHVSPSINWVDCSRSLRYKQTDGLKSMTSYYNYLIDGNFGLNILVYSGDDDDVCATIGTQSWIWRLGYRKTSMNWEPYTVSGQTAGYLTKWTGTKLAFATVHGAGHEVPTYKPDVALYLWKSYLDGKITDA